MELAYEVPGQVEADEVHSLLMHGPEVATLEVNVRKNVVSTPTRPQKPPASKVPWQTKLHGIFVDLHAILIDITLTWMLIDGIVKFLHPTLGHLSLFA
jgi:hypothetical protein